MSISDKASNMSYRASHDSWTHSLASGLWNVRLSVCHLICLVVSLLTGNLEKIGEKDDGLCSFAPVWPQPKKWAREQPAQAEGGQTQAQEVRGGLQNLEVPPYCRQNDGWGHQRGMEGGRGGRRESDKPRLPTAKQIPVTSDAISSVMCAHSRNARQILL